MSARISVVIVSYNTKDFMRDCLNSVLSNIEPSMDDIFVVDNTSTDGTPHMLEKEFPEIPKFVSSENLGFSYACNQGMKSTHGDYVLFTNGDVRLPLGTLNAMRKMMDQDPQMGVLSPQLIAEEGKLAQMSWGWKQNLFGEMRQKLFSPKSISGYNHVAKIVEFLQRKERQVPIVAGACMLVRRSLLEKTQGLDENFELYFEDADLCIRSWKAGFSVIFTPKVKVIHALGQSGKTQAKKIMLIYRQSQVYFYRKHNTFLEQVLLKVYLWAKFLITPLYWKDPSFRYWIGQILREKRRITLVSEIS